MPIKPENKKRYPADWKDLSKRIRFDRANNACEWCAAKNYQPHPTTGSKVVLTVAHLDHTPENCDESNLAALCQRCHLAYDRGKMSTFIKTESTFEQFQIVLVSNDLHYPIVRSDPFRPWQGGKTTVVGKNFRAEIEIKFENKFREVEE